ncbi:MAG: hypothetical protein R2838_17020 [Caldilineaceae bacterium]
MLIAGTGYQYGDTDFVEYGERLYQQFSRELRRGGRSRWAKGVLGGKRAYLAETCGVAPHPRKIAAHRHHLRAAHAQD